MERNMPERSDAMLCPLDGTTLVMSERQNVEIDYCPTCRGVWLDRGELDKIIERSNADSDNRASDPPPRGPQREPTYTSPGGFGSAPDRHYKKRRKSFLEEIFD
jgi:Zn-finger nucleic acid-binding protein